MPTSRPSKEAAVTPAARSRRSSPLPNDHTPSEAIAHAIVAEFNDLEPSVVRIMTSDLDEDGRLCAIQLFQRSLTAPGDPHRDPAVAIEAARRVQDQR
jgi:hypothetical protein